MLKDALVKDMHIQKYIFCPAFCFLIVLVFGKKKGWESPFLPVLLTCFYFPWLPAHKEIAKQQQIPQMTASRVKREALFLHAEHQKAHSAKSLCFLMVGQQAETLSPAQR